MAKPNKIYLYTRKDGTVWADYKLPQETNPDRIFTLTNPQTIIDNPGDVIPARIRALALRKLNDVDSIEIEIPIKAKTRTWVDILKGLFN